LRGVPGVRFISLQTGRAGTEVQASDWPAIELAGHELHDFADTAAALASLDLLVCVDTSIAHLAGAMGKPCWVLLPQHRTDWRWLRGRDDSPWYPQGMRLFRQTERGAWAPVVERVREALAALASGERIETA
jgi:ADP-heptose:LPS heptosyltransferase